MQKKAKISLKTAEEYINYEKQIEIKNNKINYLEDDNTNVLFDINKKSLIRDNKNIYLEYNFEVGKGTIYIKEYKTEVEVSIDIEELIIEDNLIKIKYKIDNNNYTYKIEME